MLREHNLYDTSRLPADNPVQPPTWDERFRTERTPDGSWNDLVHGEMGMAGTRFGRNVPIEATWPDRAHILEPSPREISRRLMTRDNGIIPASTGNALIASWLQFMLHDWVKHGTSPTDNPWVIPLEPGDDWPEPPLAGHAHSGRPHGTAGLGPATDPHQRQHPLVGRVAALRQRPRVPDLPARPRRRQAAGSSTGCRRCRTTPH